MQEEKTVVIVIVIAQTPLIVIPINYFSKNYNYPLLVAPPLNARRHRQTRFVEEKDRM